MKVKTDYSQCAYITAGKVYGVEFYSDGDLAIVDDENEVIWIDIGEGGCPHLRGNNWVVVSDEKPFDITQHEWSDVIAEIKPESGHTLVIKAHGSWLSFDKDDVIAMARDRGVIAEDLK